MKASGLTTPGHQLDRALGGDHDKSVQSSRPQSYHEFRAYYRGRLAGAEMS